MDNLDLLPDDVILDNIIPQLSLYNLLTLCRSNTRLSQLCSDEGIWRRRVFTEYPQNTRKPDEYNWRQWYITLASKQIPITFEGNVVGTTVLDLSKPNILGLEWVWSDIQNLLPEDNYTLFFLSGTKPIVVINYNKGINVSKKYRHINRLLLAKDINMNRWFVVNKSISYKPYPDYNKISSTVYEHLFSREGTPAVYGIYNSKTNEFRILTRFGFESDRFRSYGRLCDDMNIYELLTLIQGLGINRETTPELINPNLANPISQLCIFIRNRLNEIGHLIIEEHEPPELTSQLRERTSEELAGETAVENAIKSLANF